MEMLNSAHHLGKNFGSGNFREWPVLIQVVEELKSLDEFHEDVDVRISPNSLINSDYMGVVELLMNINLSPQML